MSKIGYKGLPENVIVKNNQMSINSAIPGQSTTQEDVDRGMCYCKNPFDVLDEYDLISPGGNVNDFETVEPLEPEQTENNRTFHSAKLKIGERLSFSEFVQTCIDYILGKAKAGEIKTNNYVHRAQIASDSEYAWIASAGESIQVGSSETCAQIASSGDGAKIASSGFSARVGSSGDYARIGSIGDSAQIGSSGDSVQIGSSGNTARIASSGDYARIGSSGDSAQIGSSGEYACIDSTGQHSVIMCAGHNCVARAKIGSFITLAEWVHSEEDDIYIPVNVVTKKVDGRYIKEDTYYMLVDGKFVECEGKIE